MEFASLTYSEHLEFNGRERTEGSRKREGKKGRYLILDFLLMKKA